MGVPLALWIRRRLPRPWAAIPSLPEPLVSWFRASLNDNTRAPSKGAESVYDLLKSLLDENAKQPPPPGGCRKDPMSSLQDYLSKLQQLPKLVRDLKRGSPVARLTILAAFCLFLSGVLALDLVPKDLRERLAPLHLASWFFGIAIVLVIWLVVLLSRLAVPFPSSDEKIPSNAIKGPGSFGPQDGSLFAQLGRRNEIATLRDHVNNDQVGMVAVMGESGAGKTSLLRAGLCYQIKQQKSAVPCVYWEALPTDPVAGLLHAVGAYLEPAQVVPTSLEEVLAWAKRGTGVVILDQFEQLDPKDAAHAPIFEFLRRLGDRLPPYRSTWIVAFRDEFAAPWRKFEEANPDPRRRMFFLDLFPRKRAKEVMATLGEKANLSIEDALLEDMLGVASQGGLVSPVDVGIGMLVLFELAQKLERQTLTKSDYRFAGGAEGLLTIYIVKSLSRIAESDRSPLLKGLLTLIDRNDRRVAEGRTLEEIAAASGLPFGRVKAYADLLAEARVLERLGQQRVRLLHDRIVTPLRSQAGSILADRERARITLGEGLRRWRESDGRWGLLAGAELNLVWRNRNELADRTPDDIEYLRRSRHRQLRRQALAASVAALVVASPFLVSVYNEKLARDAAKQARNRLLLSELGLPPDLYDRLGQLQGLGVSASNESPGGSPLPSLEWLNRATALTTLDLRHMLVASLRGLPKSVTTLMLSPDHRLPPLSEIPSTIRNLTLEGDIDSPLRLPRSLESLTLSVWDGAALPDLRKLPSPPRTVAVSMTHLEFLSPESSRTPDVPGAAPWVFSKLEHVTSLTIGELHSTAASPDLSGLPASVRKLALNPWAQGEVTQTELPSLPTTIESLALAWDHDPSELIGRLPPNVTFLLLDLNSRSDLAAALTRVPAVRSLALFGPPEELDLRLLPSSVEWLYLTLDFYTSPETCRRLFRTLPPSVRYLKLQVRGPSCIPAINDLPRSIQFLALKFEDGLMGTLPALSPRVDAIDIVDTEITSLKGAQAPLSQLTLRPDQVKNLGGLPDSVRILRFQFRYNIKLHDPLFSDDDFLERMLEAAGSSRRAKPKPGAAAAVPARTERSRKAAGHP
jgi:hypothetical protein